MIRRVLVTGAGSGIGLVTSLRLADAGFAAIGLVPDAEEANRLKAEDERRRRADRIPIEIVTADLSDPSARAGIASERDLWAVVNNAGYMNPGELLDVDLESARRQLEVMVLAPMDIIRQAVPVMIRRGHGLIVNITSSALHTSTPLTGWYVACKAALRELTDGLRGELASTGVDVVDIEPGGFRTGIWAGAAKDLRRRRAGSARPELYDRALRGLDRAGGGQAAGDPDRVAAAVCSVMTAGRPPKHKRVGPGARLLRVTDELVPDAVTDRVVAGLAGS